MRTAYDACIKDVWVTGVRQGYVLPLLSCFMDRIPREATLMLGGDVHIECTPTGGLVLSFQDKTWPPGFQICCVWMTSCWLQPQ